MATTKKTAAENKEKKLYKDSKINKLPGSMVEITAAIPVDVLSGYRAQALKNINETVTIDGFRKGNVPEKTLIAKVGEMNILYEMAELALEKVYPAIITDEALDVIGRPEISITKIAADNDLEFKITTAVTPEVTLGDYKKALKKIAKGEEKAEVTDEDISKILEELRTSHAKRLAHDALHALEGSNPDEESEDAHQHAPISEEDIKKNLPELNDDFAKILGNFATLDELKTRIKENVLGEKEKKIKDKARLALSDVLLETATIDIPKILVDAELTRSEGQFRDDISRMGIKVDDYLKHTKKTIDDLKEEWRDSATKKAKLQLILNTIAKEEKIRPDVKDIEKEVEYITEYYKDADKERAYVYAESVLTNELVFKFLEEQK
ncbi:MAG: hypothetical protein HZA80_00620 [Candidatus Taylorbacteria bacterium]|nr:hypothetical protein [Candidatus Taylorbacteria bacterium]